MREELTAALERLIAGELAAVILEGGGYYVQFAAEEPGLLFEALGDANLDGERLTPDQLRRLRDFGFSGPERKGGGNHSRSLPPDAPAAASMALEVLATVYGAVESETTLMEV